jgi:GT2 family glycosyltransferase
MKPMIVQLVAWNGEKYISHLFESLRAQRFHDFELWVLENGSSDNTSALIKKELENFKQPSRFIQKEKNIGFAPGHNELFRESLDLCEYVVLLNQDMQLTPDFLEKLYYFAESYPDAGSMSGRLMKWSFPDRTNIIDSLGLKAFKNHRVIDQNGGEDWRNIDDDVEAIEVFGVSGALPLYRSQAIREVIYNGEVFDEDFFSYKEDVDLAWRLREVGWYSFSVLDAVAYHDRSASGPADLKDISAAKNRKFKSELSKFYSYRNHILMLIKNYAGEGGFFATLWYELKKAGYLIIVAPRAFAKSWVGVLRLLPVIIKKRGYIQKKRVVLAEELDMWFE